VAPYLWLNGRGLDLSDRINGILGFIGQWMGSPAGREVWGECSDQCRALHCTALHCTALHCTALHCTCAREVTARPPGSCEHVCRCVWRSAEHRTLSGGRRSCRNVSIVRQPLPATFYCPHFSGPGPDGFGVGVPLNLAHISCRRAGNFTQIFCRL
jgi:hypothetical protein